MCGRFTLRAPASVIAEQFGLFEPPAFAARFNIAPTQPVLAVRMRGSADREFAWLSWGLVPRWAKKAAGGRLINIRAEAASGKGAFRDSIGRRRCLVVADGFFEWQRIGRTKQAYFIRLCDDRPFAFAGVWESSQTPDQSTLETCAILTTAPNELIRPIHDRMPAILPPAGYGAWLDSAIEDPWSLMPLLTPYPSEAMRASPVSDFVNSPAHDSPRCIEPTLPKRNALFPAWE